MSDSVAVSGKAPGSSTSDPRGLALVLFQKFHRELPTLDEMPSDRTLREMILEAVNLLPDYAARKAPKQSNLLITAQGAQGSAEALVNVQDTIDCLRTLWEEYRRDPPQSHEPTENAIDL